MARIWWITLGRRQRRRRRRRRCLSEAAGLPACRSPRRLRSTRSSPSSMRVCRCCLPQTRRSYTATSRVSNRTPRQVKSSTPRQPAMRRPPPRWAARRLRPTASMASRAISAISISAISISRRSSHASPRPLVWAPRRARRPARRPAHEHRPPRATRAVMSAHHIHPPVAAARRRRPQPARRAVMSAVMSAGVPRPPLQRPPPRRWT